MHTVPDTPVQNVPVPHVWHTVLPELLVNCPALHPWQRVPFAAKEPAGHRVQLVAGPRATHPLGQVRHVVTELALLNWLFGQAMHPGPPLDPKYPGWQATHAVLLAVAFVLAWHGVQAPAPAAEKVSFTHAVHGPAAKSLIVLA